MSDSMSKKDFTDILQMAMKPVTNEISGLKTTMGKIAEDVQETKSTGREAKLEIAHLKETTKRLEKNIENDKIASVKKDDEIKEGLNTVGIIARSAKSSIKIYVSAVGFVLATIIGLIKVLG